MNRIIYPSARRIIIFLRSDYNPRNIIKSDFPIFVLEKKLICT